MKLTLFKHQQDFLDENPDKCALVWSCGTGKTLTAILWSNLYLANALVICPKALKANWEEQARVHAVRPMTILTKEEFKKFAPKLPAYDQVIIDECFIAGTKVLTPHGYKNIEDVKVYDKIISAIGEDFVISTIQKKASQFILIKFNGKEVCVTPNHPFFTQRGWVEAGQLSIQDVLLHYRFINDMLIGYDIPMQKMRKGSSSFSLFGFSQRQKEILPTDISTKEFLQFSLSNEISLDEKKRFADEKSAFSRNKSSSFAADEKEESYEKSGLEGKGPSNHASNGSSSKSQGKQWTADADSSTDITCSSGRGMVRRARYPYSFDRIKNWLRHMLQDRYCESYIEDLRRSRWAKSQYSFKQKERQKKDEIFRGYRVESIEVQEQKDTPVFNLRVKGHPSYVVNGALVHNCHMGFLTPLWKSQMSKSLKKYLTIHKVKRVLGLSATPYTSSPWNVYNLAWLLGHHWNWREFRLRFFYDVRMGPRIIPMPKPGCERKLAPLVAKIASVVDIKDVMDVPLQYHAEPELFSLNREQERAIESAYDPLPIVRYTKEHECEQGFLMDAGVVTDTFMTDKEARIMSLIEENKKIAIVCRYNGQIDALLAKLYAADYNDHLYVIRGDVENRHEVCAAAEAADRAIVLIQADCAEGYEIPSFPICVFASQSYSYVKWEQMCGRFLRMNKPSRTTFLYLTTAGDSVDRAVYEAVKRKEDFKIELFAQRK